MTSPVFDYRLGNRSALDWVIDQYQTSTDKRSGGWHVPEAPPKGVVQRTGR